MQNTEGNIKGEIKGDIEGKIEGKNILLIDDDERLLNLIAKYLQDNGYNVRTALNTAIAIDILQHHSPSINAIICDVMLPEDDKEQLYNGIDFTKMLKNSSNTEASPDCDWHFIPIMLLTAKSSSQSRIDGLSSGADDYLAKPFEPIELLLRLKNLITINAMHKQKMQLQQQLQTQLHTDDASIDGKILEGKKPEVHFQNFTFNLENKILTKSNSRVKISSTEEKILHLLCGNLNQAFSRQEIAKMLNNVSERSVDVNIKRLRAKMGDKKSVIIKTIRNQGYCLVG